MPLVPAGHQPRPGIATAGLDDDTTAYALRHAFAGTLNSGMLLQTLMALLSRSIAALERTPPRLPAKPG